MPFTQFLPNTAAGRTILAAADAAAQRTALGLGTADSPTFAGVSTRNGLNATSSRVYNTYTDASNGEWFEIDWQTTSNVCTLGTNANGTGTPRTMSFQTAYGSIQIPRTANANILAFYNTAGNLQFSIAGNNNLNGTRLVSFGSEIEIECVSILLDGNVVVDGTHTLAMDGELSGTHLQNLGAADSPTFAGVSTRNGLNATSSRVYNTYTDASNGEWFEIDWQTTSNVLRLATNNNGTGTQRNIVLDSANRSAYIASPTNAEIRDILISFGLMAAS